MNVIAWAYKLAHLAITFTSVCWVPTVHSEANQASIVSFSFCLMFVALLSNPIDAFVEDLVVVALVLLKVFVVFAGMMLLLALPLLVCIIACKVAGLRRNATSTCCRSTIMDLLQFSFFFADLIESCAAWTLLERRFCSASSTVMMLVMVLFMVLVIVLGVVLMAIRYAISDILRTCQHKRNPM